MRTRIIKMSPKMKTPPGYGGGKILRNLVLNGPVLMTTWWVCRPL